MSTSIEANAAAILERVARAAETADRRPDEITLVAASKTFSPDKILAAYHAGVRHFGENRVEEGVEKIPQVYAHLPPGDPIAWHMIGHVQRRKAREVIRHFDVIQSVDTLKLAQALDRAALRLVPVLLEVNIAAEPEKFGLQPEPRDELCRVVASILSLSHLQVRGLMTVGPQMERPEDSAPYFRRLRELADYLRQTFPANPWSDLSMGMTADFEIAIAEGATIVRIGRAIFGERL